MNETENIPRKTLVAIRQLNKGDKKVNILTTIKLKNGQVVIS